MKICLITTTIQTPAVLELYQQYAPGMHMIVAGDRKTPQAAMDWCHEHDVTYLSPGVQSSFGYKCSDLIGWDTISRRNIALLEAVKFGADVIYSCDDDNIALDSSHFAHIDHALGRPFSGIKVSSPTGWFDVGTLLDPISPHRGFPHGVQSRTVVDHAVGCRVGVAAGMCLGDPDIGAATRLALHPEVHRVSQLLESGIVVDPKTWTVFNSQNTSFIRELAPAFFMLPGVGRMDDIYASLIMQRLMLHRELHVHFGRPYCWQSRNPHNLVKDLRLEIDGMEGVEQLADVLEDVGFMSHYSNLECVRSLWNQLEQAKFFPAQTVEAALAFLDDLEGVL